MGLQHITEDGHMHWECHSGKCPPQSAHISHEQVEWIHAGHLALPPCPVCGSRMFVKTDFTEQELLPPIITRGTDLNGKEDAILSVTVLGAFNLTWIESHHEKHIINDVETEVLFIDDVFQHPMIARHLELERQLKAIGKTHQGA